MTYRRGATGYQLAATIFALALLVACGGDGPTEPRTRTVARVAVSPDADTLFSAGETVRLTASAQDASGSEISGRSFTWSSSDTEIVTVSPEGVVTAAGPNGSATVSATTGAVEGAARVYVVTGPQGGTLVAADGQVTLSVPAGAVAGPVELTVRSAAPPASATLVGGSAYEIGPAGHQFAEAVEIAIKYDPANVPSALPEDEIRLHEFVNNDWEELIPGSVDVSEHECEAELRETGLFACVGRIVRVIKLTPANDTIAVNGALQLTAVLEDGDGHVLSNRPLNWSSSDPSVATVDDQGLVTGVTEGEVTITAESLEQTATGTATITVEAMVDRVVVTPSSATIDVTETVQLTAEVQDANGNPVVRSVTWTSSDPSVATVDANGLVTGQMDGTVTITATSEGVDGTATITVDASVQKVVVTPAADTILVGETTQLTAEPQDANGNPLPNRPVTWATSDPTVATVDGNGLVTGVGAGVATITATSEGVPGTSTITVEAAPPPPPPPGSLMCGDLVSDSITAAAEVDIFNFVGSAGDVILLTAGKTSGFSSFGSAARVRLLSPSLTEILVFDTNAQRGDTLPETGTYTIEVTANNLTSTGGYNLGYECLQPLGPVDAALVPGDLVSNSLDMVAEVDVYSFDANAGDEILLTAGKTSGFSSFGSAARVRLLSPSMTEVIFFDTNGQRRVSLPETGTYVITVTANNIVSTGGYNLGYERLLPPGPTQGTLGCGDLLSDALNAVAEVDLFDFSGSAGQVVQITISETSGFSGSNAARATLISPSGQELAVIDSPGNSQITLPENGTYIIYVNGRPLTATGSYNISLTCL